MKLYSRHIYLNLLDVEDAVNKITDALTDTFNKKTEIILSHLAHKRILSKPVYAKLSSPLDHLAAMDGIAVKAQDTFLAKEDNPILLQEKEDFCYINTGEIIPNNFDAVIMIEDIVELNNEQVHIDKAARPWQYIRRIGEDILTTDLLFTSNHELTAPNIGLLLNAGVWEVEVWKKLKITILPTGSELLDFRSKPTPVKGQIIESNSQIIKAILEQNNFTVKDLPPVPDNLQLLYNICQNELKETDCLIVLSGSSAGEKDFTRQLFQKLGEILFHGIAAMPGKPCLAACAFDQNSEYKLLFGLPGYPVSAIIACQEVLLPALKQISHNQKLEKNYITATLSSNLSSKLGVAEYIRLGLAKINNDYVAIPLARTAANLESMSKAQGITIIAKNSEGLNKYSQIKVELLPGQRNIDSTIVCIGSHDNILNLLANELQYQKEPFYLLSQHTGSMGGITALKDGFCHLAGMHLFDPEQNDFNFPYLKKYLKDFELTVLNLTIRQQGLIIGKGNPLNIQSLLDLSRNTVKFINRQKGSGTRILLDYELQKLKINSNMINGYAKEEYTHTALALNIFNQEADVGLGIYAAAKVFNLDFIPLFEERYDLVFESKHIETEKIKSILAVLSTDTFKHKIEEQGGYKTNLTGKVMQPKE